METGRQITFSPEDGSQIETLVVVESTVAAPKALGPGPATAAVSAPAEPDFTKNEETAAAEEHTS